MGDLAVMRFLVFLSLIIGAAAYIFAPPRNALEERSETAQSAQPVSGPLRTSWGSSLQSLRQQPASSQDIASSRSSPLETESDPLPLAGGPDGDMVEWARATFAAYRQGSKPAPMRSSGPDPEMWLVGQTNGWVQGEDSASGAHGLPSFEYLAAIDDLSFGQSAAQATETPQAKAKAVSAKKHRAPRVAAVSKPPAAKPVAHTSGGVEVAGPYRPRGLFARSGDRQRGRGLFGRSGRKAEREAWSVGPAR